ncbi:MAG: preprotein translocase subunit SecE [Candidatus Bipolaricaulota bacterium]|nr:preprotein translocase subunit SecE [Candidatus Bipolaricaulota bacterium]
MNVVTKVREYLTSVRTELGRVSWPSRREVVSFTVLILLMSVVLGVYLGLTDLVVTQLLRLLLQR